MFCVVCGKETEEELRGGVCADCFLTEHVLASLPEHVDVEVCVHCHARKRGEVWLTGHAAVEPIIAEAVEEAIRWDKIVEKARTAIDVRPEDERNFTVQVIASGLAEGLPFEKEIATRSRMKNATCIRCSRMQGGYYEAIVQVRAARRDLTKDEMRAVRQFASRFIERIVTDGDRNAFVLRDVEEHGGLDVYMGTTNSGRMLAKQLWQEYGGKLGEHAKTVGQKDGLDLIRMTFALRFPEYRAGDYVVLGNEVFEVRSLRARNVVLQEPRTGRARHLQHEDLEKATVLSRDDAKEAIVVSQTSEELQLLDPWTYNTVSVLRPSGLDEVGEAVDVLRFDGELIVLRPRAAST